MYLQQQQQQQQQRHLHYMSAAASSMRPSPTPASGLTQRLVPETITVSDDDDEPPMALVKRQPPADKPAEASLSSSKSAEAASSEKCSPKDRSSSTPFVPYREPQPETGRLPPSSSPSTSFMPNFFSAKPELKPETQKDAPPKPDACDASVVANIKEEPKEELHVEVGDDEADASHGNQVFEVKEEGVNRDLKEYADLLLLLSNSPHQPAEELPLADVAGDDFSGLDLLLEGIQMIHHEGVAAIDGLELLYAVTRYDASSLGVGDDISVLCAVTAEDYFNYLNWVDPMVELKRRFNLHHYKCASSQLVSRKYITARIKKFKKLNAMHNDNEKCLAPPDFESLDEVIKRIKNTDIMSQLEVELRSRLAQLQDLYRDKQKEMSRLKSSPRKVASGHKSRCRGPGRPKKRCLKSSAKTKMGRPRKRPESGEAAHDDDDDDDEDEEEEEEEDMSPPVLQPWSTASRSPSPPPLDSPKRAPVMGATSTTGGLLKPPKLTASFSMQQQLLSSSSAASGGKKFGSSSSSVTNLSMINARFMKGKANPFQNLMKLASTPATATPTSASKADARETSSSTDDEDDDAEGAEEPELTTKLAKEEARASKELTESERKYSDHEDGSASKRRKSENPRRHFGSTETIVHKQPKNLFMMNCINMQRGFSEKPASKADEYDFRDNDDDLEDVPEVATEDDRWSKAKMLSQYRDNTQTSSSSAAAAQRSSKPAWSPSVVTKAATVEKAAAASSSSVSLQYGFQRRPHPYYDPNFIFSLPERFKHPKLPISNT
jgi:hypothetical protein